MKVIKSCDLTGPIAGKLFAMLNAAYVYTAKCGNEKVLVSKVHPDELIYPEGWYYAKGAFRNKHNSTTGLYDEIPILKEDGSSWHGSAAHTIEVTYRPRA